MSDFKAKMHQIWFWHPLGSLQRENFIKATLTITIE